MKKIILIKIFIIVVFLTKSYAYDFIISSVPFFPSKAYQCGPTSLAMVLNFWGINIKPSEIASEIYSKDAKGTSDFDMLFYAKKFGLKVEQYRGNLDDLKDKIKRGHPLIVMVDEGFWFYKKYHYMVVVGFSEGEIIVNSSDKERERIEIEKFLNKWNKTDFWTLYIYREVKNGSS
ncbi:MAG: C39 family peptidase [Thermodesulfovibrio sp.]|uniref:C39 family peptidase n=1 Tax=unclassified Thermodesulfovibrio TaxID=2645936 RepID=UPI00083A1EF7|nr:MULTISPECIES: C39 family peptidase [unclassified Thermodesulfovibrio]MDI1472055.1 C39 family peptidase [Thermodesulfovibrio sp. 1176]MDI6713743.1 C39 family peptidase [Thermodesulfovibrio sp.]ODA45187.1 hypothetical protein THER_0062 [Thermodesulfovibrio sp. N1]